MEDRTSEGRTRVRWFAGTRDLWQDRVYRTLCYLVSLVWCGFTIFPLFWLLGSTFKDSVDIMKMPPDFFPRIPRLYTIQLDFTDVAASQPQDLERIIKEDMAIATWEVPDYLPAIHLGKIAVEGYINGRKVAETSLPTYNYGWYRGRIWVTQLLSDNQVRKHLEEAIFPIHFKLDLEGSLPVGEIGGPTEYTEQVASLFGDKLNPTARVMAVGSRTHWLSMFNNFISAWRAPDRLYKGMTFAGYMLNGLAITGSQILLQWVVSGMAAYALSRILSPGMSRLWTLFFIVTMMLPGIATLIPTYELVGKLGMHDTLLGVIVPSIPGAFTIYLFKGFFDALPGEIFDAARIDGASEVNTFARIAVPMSKNVFVVIGLLTFLSSWNNFFWPFLILRSPKVWTFTIAIYMAMGGSGAARASYGSAMASAVMASLPTVIVFALFSRTIQQGLVWSGLKG